MTGEVAVAAGVAVTGRLVVEELVVTLGQRVSLATPVLK